MNSKLQSLRHSAEHILTQAMERLYPNQFLMAMGPATDDGFYFDFEPTGDFKINETDFPKIEAEMTKIVKENLPIIKKEISLDEAKKIFKDNPYKMEWLNSIKNRGEVISIYQTGDEFVDLCAGPHVRYTSQVKAFKLLSVAGAYWHGDENNKMLTRIYGTAFENKKELDHYLWQIEEAKKRDHRKLGNELDLFSISESIGPGLILWHPKLSIIREEIENYWRSEHRKQGYQYVFTPHIGMSNLWETSGHLGFYQDSMYPPMLMKQKSNNENNEYYVKPMSCPFHIQIYKSRPRSYRELPLRWCELGSVYRYEESGVLHGMLRVRGFTQDDAHIICREDQFVEEINNILDFALSMNKTFGYNQLNVYLSIRGSTNTNKYVGDQKVWNLAEKTLEEVLTNRKIKFQKDIGGAKFYGPAIDLKAVDAMGREWQGTTIQLDMNLPMRFDMKYIGQDGQEHTPIMIHRTLLGSMERFVGTLIEHYAGAFPLWLSPMQVKIIPITDNQLKYAQQIETKLKENHIRVEIDDKSETMQNKIRTATSEKIPYLIIVGAREIENQTISVRQRDGQDLGTMKLTDFISQIKDQITNKALNLIK
ncbi:MAG TPA: threonine--tRNA ligase [Candidatus Woesebacteria bacterium]|jgi:threonyl-tRNA synthetase|nr:threonine--tRNA ligase [Candidatus Shapirobacteria bacterium]HOR02255.1 threonine--tRNA ligase [Candidatus Woesebacteria bacterium]